ncbi:MAG: YIP1 family protein [Anaerolineaceae bacterium]|nr:YIP1 family protein [Anaerolineaceae bacterium]
MATQVGTMPVPLARNNNESSPGIIGQIVTLITQPVTFFHNLPQNRQWVWVAVLILIIFGFAASNQVQSETTASSTQTTSGFDLSLLQSDASATTSTSSSTQSTTSDSTDTNTLLMTALLAAGSILVMWGGQTILLCVIPMLRGYPPHIGRNLQIAVWASLPLALMLGLRQLYFAAGGAGGSTGLSLLLEQWDGYATLPEATQSVLAVFMSNVTVFWLWSLMLLYFGARHALNGRRWSVLLVLVIWVATASIVPALVSEPVTTIAPRGTTTAVEQTSTSTTTNSTTTNSGQSGAGNTFPGDMSGGGMPPSGGGAPPGG